MIHDVFELVQFSKTENGTELYTNVEDKCTEEWKQEELSHWVNRQGESKREKWTKFVEDARCSTDDTLYMQADKHSKNFAAPMIARAQWVLDCSPSKSRRRLSDIEEKKCLKL